MLIASFCLGAIRASVQAQIAYRVRVSRWSARTCQTQSHPQTRQVALRVTRM
jgi:hypothetical protein